jgi:hypothetical protein
MDAILRSELSRSRNGEHDGALRGSEQYRYLILAGAWLDFEGAFREWLTYSHLVSAPHLRLYRACITLSIVHGREPGSPLGHSF